MQTIIWLGDATAFFAYAALFFIAAIAHSKNLTHRLLSLFGLAGCFWASVHLAVKLEYLSTSWLNWAESIRIICSSLLLYSLLNQQVQYLKTLLSHPLVIGIILLSFILPVLSSLLILEASWFFIGYLTLTIALLILLEILYRQAKSALWGLKPLILALGALLTYDFIVFADASLLSAINPDMWIARGYLHTCLVPLLLWSIKRSKTLGINIYVSREMVFQSSLLFAAGIYISIMAVTGFYIKSIESQWSGMIQTVFIVLAFVVLFALFISESIKRNFKVFLEKNFYANRFDYRVQWLKLTNLLNTPLTDNQDFYQRSLEVFINSIDYDSGALYKFKNRKLELTAELGEKYMNDLGQCHCENLLYSLLPYIQQKHWIIDLKHYQHHKNRYPELHLESAEVESCPFHVVIPIYQQGNLWGLVCLNNSTGEYLSFNWEIRDYMTVVTNQVGHYISQHEANKIITENAQFAAFSRMSAFVIHDLKNVLAQIDMILANAQKHKNNPEFIDDTFETLGYTKQRMEKMLSQLMNKTADENKTQQSISLNQLIEQVISNQCQNMLPAPQFISKSPIEINLDTEKFSNVLYHLIDNAQQATADSGRVTIIVDQQPTLAVIKIEDTGCGMSAEFIKDKLFKPFETTKGNAGMGIGAYDAKLYIEQLGGRLIVNSIVGQGTEFIIELPLTDN
ncbi:PEP-CTERM system histidine kinase PrsK [Catenovulum sp. 2E275]|uniref:XrtA/PEP-CTERM system histidine kinase PrsK n=1 Tax=Catenovulum sp. 2E275 TaxID=2980497 RepID=UPI0021D393D2|nr:XrtA/PEP-CTERM system histidine kinase PrsK [Catenovulum sp. 2E275]MCU4675575.1 PEP-CTERM system histidine kinase PrsK [Catenovulum sp. 2E275]